MKKKFEEKGISIVCPICLVSKNSSEFDLEHIIPNALGGRFKIKPLLCKSCNSTFGHEIEGELAKQFAFFMNRFNIPRERGDLPELELKDPDTGEKILLDHLGRPRYADPPKINIEPQPNGRVHIQIKARNEKDVKQILRGLRRKYPAIPENMNFPTQEKYFDVPLQVQFSIGGIKCFRAIAKMAFGYLTYKKGIDFARSSVFDPIRSFVHKGIEQEIVYFYSLDSSLIQFSGKELNHIIILSLSSSHKNIIAYVELFSVCCFLILLTDKYEGQEECFSYSYNPITREESDTANVLWKGLPTEKAREIILNKNKRPVENIAEHIRQLLPFALKRQTNAIFQYAAKSGANVLNKYPPGTPITKEIIHEITEETMKHITPLIIYNARKHRQNRK